MANDTEGATDRALACDAPSRRVIKAGPGKCVNTIQDPDQSTYVGGLMAKDIVGAVERLECVMERAQVIADTLGLASQDAGPATPWVLLLQNLVGEFSEAVESVGQEVRRA